MTAENGKAFEGVRHDLIDRAASLAESVAQLVRSGRIDEAQQELQKTIAIFMGIPDEQTTARIPPRLDGAPSERVSRRKPTVLVEVTIEDEKVGLSSRELLLVTFFDSRRGEWVTVRQAEEALGWGNFHPSMISLRKKLGKHSSETSPFEDRLTGRMNRKEYRLTVPVTIVGVVDGGNENQVEIPAVHKVPKSPNGREVRATAANIEAESVRPAKPIKKPVAPVVVITPTSVHPPKPRRREKVLDFGARIAEIERAELAQGEIYTLAFVLLDIVKLPKMRMEIGIDSRAKALVEYVLFAFRRFKPEDDAILVVGNLNRKLEIFFADPEGVVRENRKDDLVPRLFDLLRGMTPEGQRKFLLLVRNKGQKVTTSVPPQVPPRLTEIYGAGWE